MKIGPQAARSTAVSAANAALVNGANTHGLDFDDGHTNGSAHPSGVVFPAVLAAAEQYGAGPREVVAAVVAGYDVMARLASAMHPVTARRGYHTVAGFALAQLGRFPRLGSAFETSGWRFEVVDIDGRRIDKVLAQRLHRAAIVR